jgi:hypothetical protein
MRVVLAPESMCLSTMTAIARLTRRAGPMNVPP